MNGTESTHPPPSLGVPSGLTTALLLFLLLAAGAVAAILFLFDPAKHGFYPFCLFHRTTGWLCPGCGSLRAFHHLLNGELALALRHNLLVVLSLPLFLFLAGRLILSALGRPVRPLTIPGRWIWLGLAVLILFGIARNLPFAQTLWLAP